MDYVRLSNNDVSFEYSYRIEDEVYVQLDDAFSSLRKSRVLQLIPSSLSRFNLE